MQYCALKKDKNVFSGWVDLYVSLKLHVVERKNLFILKDTFWSEVLSEKPTNMTGVIYKPLVSCYAKKKKIKHILLITIF